MTSALAASLRRLVLVIPVVAVIAATGCGPHPQSGPTPVLSPGPASASATSTQESPEAETRSPGGTRQTFDYDDVVSAGSQSVVRSVAQRCLKLDIVSDIRAVLPKAKITLTSVSDFQPLPEYEWVRWCAWGSSKASGSIVTGVSRTKESSLDFVRRSQESQGLSYEALPVGDDGILVGSGTTVSGEVLVRSASGENRTYTVAVTGDSTAAEARDNLTRLLKAVLAHQ